MTTTTNAKHGPEFGRQRLPERFCNLDRLLAGMEARELDGLVVTTPLNFHGLGLSHIDFELRHPDGRPHRDWVLEENMVLPVHLFYPGGERERAWLEEVVAVGSDGGRPLLGWGFEPLTGD